MLLKPGAESHTFEPTPDDIKTIKNSDIFIYVGGDSDEWDDDILSDIDTDKTKIIKLIDLVDAKEEVTTEGMESDEEEESEEEVELDEHVWTSSKNAKEFKFYIEQKSYGSKSKDSLIPILSSSENTYKSITSVFSEKMAIFDDVNVANVTSKSDFDFDILGKEQSALFVIVPDEDKIYYNLVTIILGLLYKELVKFANSTENKKCPIEIDWICDEFSNCHNL